VPRGRAAEPWCHLLDVFFVFELLDTDLHKVTYSGQPLSLRHLQFFCGQLLHALRSLHRAGVIHRDVKPANCLLSCSAQLKLCDFGLARGLLAAGGGEETPGREGAAAAPPSPGQPLLTEYVVTRWYRAPEILLGCREYGSPVDVWAAGAVIAEVAKRGPLFPGKEHSDTLRLIVKTVGLPSQPELLAMRPNDLALTFCKRLEKRGRAGAAPLEGLLPPPAPADAARHALALDLLGKMLTFQPEKRITVDAALAHPFLAECGGSGAPVSQAARVGFEWEARGGSGSLGVDVLKREMFRVIQGSRDRAASASRGGAPPRALLPGSRGTTPGGGTPGGGGGSSGSGGAGGGGGGGGGAAWDAGDGAAASGGDGGGPPLMRPSLLSWRGLFGGRE
jgi:serine/threonine protein kinase